MNPKVKDCFANLYAIAKSDYSGPSDFMADFTYELDKFLLVLTGDTHGMDLTISIVISLIMNMVMREQNIPWRHFTKESCIAKLDALREHIGKNKVDPTLN